MSEHFKSKTKFSEKTIKYGRLTSESFYVQSHRKAICKVHKLQDDNIVWIYFYR